MISVMRGGKRNLAKMACRVEMIGRVVLSQNYGARSMSGYETTTDL